MTNREYDNWINELCESEDEDLRGLGKYATTRAWRLESYFECDSTKFDDVDKAIRKAYGNGLSETFCVEDQDELDESIKEGWLTLHGKYMAAWCDGR